jgi:hypothetical protein
MSIATTSTKLVQVDPCTLLDLPSVVIPTRALRHETDIFLSNIGVEKASVEVK